MRRQPAGSWSARMGPCGSPQPHASIGRISTSGVITDYTGPGAGRGGTGGIAAGPDGALWFTSETVGTFSNVSYSIGRITTNGVVTVYTGPAISKYQSRNRGRPQKGLCGLPTLTTTQLGG